MGKVLPFPDKHFGECQLKQAAVVIDPVINTHTTPRNKIQVKKMLDGYGHLDRKCIVLFVMVSN